MVQKTKLSLIGQWQEIQAVYADEQGEVVIGLKIDTKYQVIEYEGQVYKYSKLMRVFGRYEYLVLINGVYAIIISSDKGNDFNLQVVPHNQIMSSIIATRHKEYRRDKGNSVTFVAHGIQVDYEFDLSASRYTNGSSTITKYALVQSTRDNRRNQEYINLIGSKYYNPDELNKRSLITVMYRSWYVNEELAVQGYSVYDLVQHSTVYKGLIVTADNRLMCVETVSELVTGGIKNPVLQHLVTAQYTGIGLDNALVIQDGIDGSLYLLTNNQPRPQDV